MALFLPFVRVVAGFAASLAALYLLIGVDPSGPVGDLVVGYVDLSLPIAGRVVAFWVFYSILYLLLGSFDLDLRVSALLVAGVARSWMRRAFQPWFRSAFIALPCSPLSKLTARFYANQRSHSIPACRTTGCGPFPPIGGGG